MCSLKYMYIKKKTFLEFSEGKIVSKHSPNCAVYQYSPRISMPSNPPSRYMTTIYNYFCYCSGKIVTKHLQNSPNCGHTKKNPGESCSRTLLAIAWF